MGQEISASEFDASDFAEFRRRVDEETQLLADWFAAGRLRSSERRVGFEMEGWLVDSHGHAAARNREFLDAVDDPMVVPELSRFNFEINSEPQRLGDGALDRLYSELDQRWGHCRDVAAALDIRPLMIGILPTIEATDLCLGNMSPLQRYQAINDQVFRLRHGKPIQVEIDGVEPLRHLHHDVMLEAGTTSLQLHVEVDAREAARAFNVCKMLSAITVGAAANSPYLFQHQLWQETRIALFEQAVAVGGSDYSKRVTFGIRYARDSILECFEANRLRYPVILPDLMDAPREQLAHLRLHNGTVWRWNRPLIGFGADGEPHCRIEHRVVAAGPTPVDAIANTALFLGLFEALMRSQVGLEKRLPFAMARDNFYAAARSGLMAEVRWPGQDPKSLRDLLLEHLVDVAIGGLVDAGVPSGEAARWLDLIRVRAQRGMTGADWQVAWVARHGRDFAGLVDAYARRQASGEPVHDWSLL